MFISDEQAHKLLNPLYNVAEKDQNDVIANAASALAVRIETKKSRYLLTTLEQRIIQYALKNQPIMPEVNQNRRKTYKRRVSLA
jgi:hypothetical protein